MSTTLDCKEKGIGNSEFVAKTHIASYMASYDKTFLSDTNDVNYYMIHLIILIILVILILILVLIQRLN